MSAHIARKRFGQNFLVDDAILGRIIASLGLKSSDHVIEIGPGQGALTRFMLEKVDKFDAIEIDNDLIEGLNQRFADFKQWHLHHADALRFDLSTIISENHPARLIGNLPYNIASQLLLHFSQWQEQLVDMQVMLQKEMADRLLAAPGSSDYSRFSVMMQYYWQCELLVTIPPSAFRPQPKVVSSFVRLSKCQRTRQAKSLNNFAQLVRQAFANRRKTLRNNLKGLLHEQQIEQTGISPQQRPEELSVEQFIELSDLIGG